MRNGLFVAVLAGAMLAGAMPAGAQAPRSDVIWARTTAGAAITLDGHLDEPAWAKAESVIVRYGVDNGIPGSGWKVEQAGQSPSPMDPTFATIKFLVVGNQLYMGAVVRDSSVGGSQNFNQFDGFLIGLKDHSTPSRPAPPAEYTYTWWYPNDNGHDEDINKLPGFIGKWGVFPPDQPRTATEIANWDAVTIVNGRSNSDTTADVGYTTEMRFNLTPMGYDVTQAGGDVVEWNISVYDCDWLWPPNFAKFNSNRSWYEDPWSNDDWYSNVKIHSRPDVTINSGPVPATGPDLVVPNAGNLATPVIDGSLSDVVWSHAPHFDIRYGDDALRASYPGEGPWRSGQFQPTVNGGQAAVVDPGDATVYYFFQGDSLYLGFDVRDQVVQYRPEFDRWDGFIVTINERGTRGPDNNLISRRLTFQVGPDGQALAQDYLPFLRDSLHGAKLALALKPNTTVDTLGQQADEGYTAELALDLTKLGYHHGLDDGSAWLGIDLLDGDSFTPFTDSYGSRTWWQREYENVDGPAWLYLNPNQFLSAAVDPGGPHASAFQALGNYPNPFSAKTAIRFRLPQASRVQIDLYDMQGRRIMSRDYGMVLPGDQHVVFEAPGTKPGVYVYRLRMADPASGASRATLSGRLVLVR